MSEAEGALSRAALFTYSFAPIDSPDAERAEAEAYLRKTWEGCDALGMSAPVSESVGTAFPSTPTEPASFRLLAAKTKPAGDGVYQAFMFLQHDTWGVVVCMAPNRAVDSRATWRTLGDEWSEACDADPPETLLGEALVFAALAREPQQVATELPVPVNGPPFVTESGFALWEGAGEGRRRTFAAVAEERYEKELDSWAWWSGGASLPPLGRCLLHASKIRYEDRVYGRASNPFSSAVKGAEVEFRDPTALPDVVGRVTPIRAHELQATEALLAERGTKSAGLAFSITFLSDLRHTITIARDNLTAAAPTALAAVGTPSPFESDLELANFLVRQIDHDIGYATAVRERSKEADSLTRLRLQLASQRHEQQRNRLVLFQTALFSALLTGVSAVGLLNLNVPLRGPLQWPLTVLIMSLALALPLLFAHWYENYGAIDLAAGAGVGAALGWFMASLPSRGAPPGVSIVAALAGAVAVVLALSLGARARRQKSGSAEEA
jgi:hypothetical protein